MSDITRAELYALGLRGAALSGVSTVDQDAELEASSATCRAYVRQRYAANLAAALADPAYKGAVAKVATHRLLSTRGYNPDNGADAIVLVNHDNALRFLRDVSKGLASLDVGEVAGDGFAEALDPDPGVGIMSDERRSG